MQDQCRAYEYNILIEKAGGSTGMLNCIIYAITEGQCPGNNFFDSPIPTTVHTLENVRNK